MRRNGQGREALGSVLNNARNRTSATVSEENIDPERQKTAVNSGEAVNPGLLFIMAVVSYFCKYKYLRIPAHPCWEEIE